MVSLASIYQVWEPSAVFHGRVPAAPSAPRDTQHCQSQRRAAGLGQLANLMQARAACPSGSSAQWASPSAVARYIQPPMAIHAQRMAH